MTSSTQQPKPPLSERISKRLSGRGPSRVADPEERFTRNVTIGFIVLIIGAAAVVIIGLGYGYWDANLKPLANVGGVEISRPQYEDRVALDKFRLDRAERAVRSGLADGSINSDLGNKRLSAIATDASNVGSTAMDEVIDLTFQQQLAESRGITLSTDELDAAVAADGTSKEARRVSAIVIRSAEEAAGMPPTAEGRAKAQASAEAAVAALKAGTAFSDVAAEYSTETVGTDGDLGYLERGDISDGLLEDTIFSLQKDAVSDIITGQSGELIIVVVTDIVPPTPDPGFLDAVNKEIGAGVHRHNVELEALAAKLKDQVTSDALSATHDQVRLAEILLHGDPTLDPSQDEGQIRASHILYAPQGADSTLPVDQDPAWQDAKAKADKAAADLRAIANPEDRIAAFAALAKTDSDGPTGPNGGDLGFFGRNDMVAEFADALFNATDLVRGDIVGPVQTQYGWHVIMYMDRRPPLADRLATVQAALAADGADFYTVARDYSEGPEAPQGGETGWHVVDDLDPLTTTALAATEVGGVTDPVEGDLGYYIYLKEDEANRPLDADAAARLAPTAFSDWYDQQKTDAEDAGTITIDSSFYDLAQA